MCFNSHFDFSLLQCHLLRLFSLVKRDGHMNVQVLHFINKSLKPLKKKKIQFWDFHWILSTNRFYYYIFFCLWRFTTPKQPFLMRCTCSYFTFCLGRGQSDNIRHRKHIQPSKLREKTTELLNNCLIALTSSLESLGTPFWTSGHMTESFLLEWLRPRAWPISWTAVNSKLRDLLQNPPFSVHFSSSSKWIRPSRGA